MNATQLTLVSPSGVSIKPLVESAFRSELRIIEVGLKRTERQLKAFEEKYRMSSSEFYQTITNDELDETLDAIEWAGEYRTLLKLQEKRQTLLEIRFAN